MFRRLVSGLMMLCTNVPDVWSTDSVFFMSAVSNDPAGVDGVLQYPPPYPFGENISRDAPRLIVRWLAMRPVSQASRSGG